MEKYGTLTKFRNLQKGKAKEIKKGRNYHFALSVEEKTKDNLSKNSNNIKLSIYFLLELSRKLKLLSKSKIVQ